MASLIGVLGAWRTRPFLTVLGAGLMFLESIPLVFSFAWLTVLASGLFLVAARESAPLQRAARIGARLIGSLGALAVLVILPSLLKGTPLFLLLLLIALAFAAVAAWWPLGGNE